MVSDNIPEITVVVPVYNVEAYLPECLASLEAQTFRDFCVIAVNDGSTDRSGEILWDYAQTHPWLYILEQENQGLGMARNNAIKLVKSPYITFLDSDDFLKKDYLECLHHTIQINRADISCCYEYYYFDKNKFVFATPLRKQGVYSKEQAVNLLLQDVFLRNFAFVKLYKTDLFLKNNICYPSGLIEDIRTSYRLFLAADCVAVSKKPCYYYRQRANSIMCTVRPKLINSYFRAIADVRIGLENLGCYEKYKNSYRKLVRKSKWTCYLYWVRLTSVREIPFWEGIGRIRSQFHGLLSPSLSLTPEQRQDIILVPDVIPVRLPSPKQEATV